LYSEAAESRVLNGGELKMLCYRMVGKHAAIVSYKLYTVALKISCGTKPPRYYGVVRSIKFLHDMAFYDDDKGSDLAEVSDDVLGEVLDKDEDEDEIVEVPPVEEEEKGWE